MSPGQRRPPTGPWGRNELAGWRSGNYHPHLETGLATKAKQGASPQPTAAPAPEGRWWLVPVLLLVGLGLLTSVNSLANGFVCDDQILIRQNRDLDSWSTLYKGFTQYLMLPWVYRPVIFLSLFVDKQLWGLHPFGYHLTNLVYHLGVVVLVFLWGALVLGDRRVALAGGLLFAVMPVHSESVAWVSGRSDLICACYFMLALYLATYSLLGSRLRVGAYWASVAVFGVAMLSKEMSATLPLVLALSMLAFGLPRWAGWRWRWRLFVPYLVVLALYFVARRLAIGHFMSGPFPNANILTTFSATPLIALWYLWLIVQPSGSRLYYQLGKPQIAAAGPWPFLGLALLLAALVYAWNRRRQWSFLGWWFLVTMLPVTLIPTDPRLADHYIYLPSAGIALLAGALGMAALAWARQEGSASLHRLMLGAMVVLLAGLGGISAWRNLSWRSTMTFYANMVQESPQLAIAHCNLGVELFRQGQYREAFQELEKARQLEPRWPAVLANIAGGYYQLGQYQQAIDYYRQALQGDPHDLKSYLLLGRSLNRINRPQEAITVLQEGERRAPGAYDFRRELAIAYQKAGRFSEAEPVLHGLLQANPRDYEVALTLGAAREQQGKYDQAIATWQELLRANPKMTIAHYLCGLAYQKQGKPAQARAAYQAYLRVDAKSDLAQEIKRQLSRLPATTAPAPRQP